MNMCLAPERKQRGDGTRRKKWSLPSIHGVTSDISSAQAVLHGAGTPAFATASVPRIPPWLSFIVKQAFIQHMDATVHCAGSKIGRVALLLARTRWQSTAGCATKVARVMQEHLEHPCALLNCQCISHASDFPPCRG